MGKETFHPGAGEEKNLQRKDFIKLTIWKQAGENLEHIFWEEQKKPAET